MSDPNNVSLLWQYQYGSRWINHNAQKLEVINKAYNKRQKSVRLPDKDPKKQIVLYFEKMYQKNKISGCEQRIRCCVFNEDFFVWQWEDDDDDVWNNYVPAISIDLEIAFTLKKTIFKFSLKHAQEVNLTTFKQKDVTSGNIYNVKREKIEIVEATFVKQIALAFSSYLKAKCEQSEDPNRERPEIKKIKLDQTVSIKNENIVEYKFKGSVPVDQACRQLIKDVHVYNEGPDMVYDATLNQTNLRWNNNKFYRMQILKRDLSSDYYVWFHWGRVGANGQNKLISCENLLAAKSLFTEKFLSKTCNLWKNRNSFVKYDGKYDLVKMDYGVKDAPVQLKKKKRTGKLNLHPKVIDVLQMMSSTAEITKYVVAMKYDIKKLPLGKLTKDQIKAGYRTLEQIEMLIRKQSSHMKLVDASSDFYTRIPHDFGMKIPPIINSLEEIKEKMELLDTLSNIEVTVEIQNNCNSRGENLLDFLYKMLSCDLKPITEDNDMYSVIKSYLYGSHGPTHNNYKMEIINIYECYKSSEQENFIDVGNKTLLWHGSRITNFVSILKHGLLIAPPEAPSTGFMFGKGLYFADVSSKSANYCHATKKNNSGLLLLCEVALGKENILFSANEDAALDTMRKKKNSVKAIGKYVPCDSENIVRSGIKIPLGHLHLNELDDLSLLYNEYVIYNCSQVKLKYLLHIKFNFF